MAPVEYESFCIETNKTLATEYVNAGEVKEFSAFDRTDIMVCCNLKDSKGMVKITTVTPDTIGALIIEDSPEFDSWQEADIRYPIEFADNQHVVIYSENDPTEICVHHFDKSTGPKQIAIITRERDLQENPSLVP